MTVGEQIERVALATGVGAQCLREDRVGRDAVACALLPEHVARPQDGDVELGMLPKIDVRQRLELDRVDQVGQLPATAPVTDRVPGVGNNARLRRKFEVFGGVRGRSLSVATGLSRFAPLGDTWAVLTDNGGIGS